MFSFNVLVVREFELGSVSVGMVIVILRSLFATLIHIYVFLPVM